jgi:ribosomal protein S27E
MVKKNNSQCKNNTHVFGAEFLYSDLPVNCQKCGELISEGKKKKEMISKEELKKRLE